MTIQPVQTALAVNIPYVVAAIAAIGAAAVLSLIALARWMAGK
jgi:hypothetical protein